jgi:hypothetical protein
MRWRGVYPGQHQLYISTERGKLNHPAMTGNPRPCMIFLCSNPAAACSPVSPLLDVLALIRVQSSN